jgi:hypothetical protein
MVNWKTVVALLLVSYIAAASGCVRSPQERAFQSVRAYAVAHDISDKTKFMAIAEESNTAWVIHTADDDFTKRAHGYRGHGYYFSVDKRTGSVTELDPIL